MQAGTTGSFGVNSNCTWHLMSSTPYKGIEKIWINISQSHSGVAGKKKADNTVRIYTGSSFEDIIRNGHKTGITLDSLNKDFTYTAD